MLLDKKTGKPYINVWFGNFYKPAYDDKEFVKEQINFIKELGFNSVLLDTKAWEDFKERCEGGEATQFVAMHEYMQQELERQGMSHEFLALYLNGDNLYPNIRFSPPIYGESVVREDGRDGKWYRYWSDKAKDSMEQHVKRIWDNYKKNNVTLLQNGEERKPICSMWDPIVAPSFDEEGKGRYLTWLKNRYQNNIQLFNQAYETDAKAFEELTKEEYWFTCKYPESITFLEEDVKQCTPKARMMMDNRQWQCDELCLYFEDMERRLHRIDKQFYLCPDMAQWGYFLNVDGSMLSGVGFADLWDTAARGIDIYRLAKYVDSANFISVPVTPAGDPDVYVTSCHHSMMRNMNCGREFMGGIYWGRFLYNDLYAVITPCETVASIVASGASGYTSYGMCGLDDGGVLHRMESSFHDSLAVANTWAKEVIPKLGKRKDAQVAILFPTAMAAYETMRTEGNKERRIDLLGWYKACCDLGVDVDVIDCEGLISSEEKINQYKVLILSEDDCYEMNPQPCFEKVLKEWCEKGGVLMYGPWNAMVKNTFRIEAEKHLPDAFLYKEKAMVKSSQYCTYPLGTTVASFLSDGKPCITKYKVGNGVQYAFGFDYGYAYTAKIAPHVPVEQKNNELYPLKMLKEDILEDLLEMEGISTEKHRGIEKNEFENGAVIINHTSYPYTVVENGERKFQIPVNESFLLPHSSVAVFYKKEEK